MSSGSEFTFSPDLRNTICFEPFYRYIIYLYIYLFIYTLLVSLFVWLSVCIQKTSKRLNQSGPNFVWDLTWPQSDFKYAILKYFYLKLFNFVKFWKWPKNIMKSANLKKIYTVQREDVKKEDVKRPKSLLYYIYIY